MGLDEARRYPALNRRTLWIGLGIGTAGILGYGAARILKGGAGRRRRRNADGKGSEIVAGVRIEPEEAACDRRPEKRPCPGCGRPVSEYEFFCPFCGYSFEKDRPHGPCAGNRI